jgi:flagellar biosynthesis/type III secretory pathway ATPase
MPAVTTSQHRDASGELRSLLAAYREAEDLINIGAYVEGSNPRIDRARAHIDRILGFLRQKTDEHPPYEETASALQGMFS